jgi:SAM-dependent methyltransferase
MVGKALNPPSTKNRKSYWTCNRSRRIWGKRQFSSILLTKIFLGKTEISFLFVLRGRLPLHNEKNKIIAADFDRLAGAGPAKHRWNHNNHYYSLMIKSIPPELPRSAPVLDVGCGTGQLCRMLAERFDKATGIDLSEGQLNIARSYSSPRCEYVLGDFLEMPLEINSFACIVSAAAAHHMPYGEFLQKCREALMPGGALIVLDLYRLRTVTDYALSGLAFLPNRALDGTTIGTIRSPKPKNDCGGSTAGMMCT